MAFPTDSNPRLLAWQILRRWSPEGTYAEDMVDFAAEKHRLSAPNRGLLNAIVMAVLRHRTLLDAWIDFLRDGGSLEDDAREWLRTGLAQLHIMGLADHAAVNETVSLAGRARGLVNAVLRRSLREKERIFNLRRDAPAHIRHSLPLFLVEGWQRQFGAAAVELLGEWMNTPAPVFVRINRLKPEAAQVIPALTGAAPSSIEGWYEVPSPPRQELADGLCYAQDPSTGMAPALLAAAPGQAVLDACAAPGGKTAILAQDMQNSGILIASDTSAKRLERLRSNMARMGATVVEPMLMDWERSPEPLPFRQRFRSGFDRILLDVPCSNTGVLRRRVDARWRLQPSFFSSIAKTQQALLRRMLELLKPGGRLVYSTCSIEPQENDLLARAVLQEMPGWRMLEDQWMLPHRDRTDGAYAALIERNR